jgi:dimethylamine monooxygenase subunit A
LTEAVRSKAQGAPGAGDADAAGDRLRWTSAPRWRAPELPAAASYLACWFGPAGRRQAEALLCAATPDVPVRSAGFAGHWDTAAEAELRRLLGDCFTGVRIILAGPESVVMRAAALARQFGATSEELVLIATEAAGAGSGEYVAGPAGRRVFCATCRRPFDAVAAMGGIVTCPGCATALVVDHRFSRPHAAYLGWPARLDLHR